MIIKRRLLSTDYQLLCLESGGDLLKEIQPLPEFDLILYEVEDHNSEARALLAQLRAAPRTEDIPIILLTTAQTPYDLLDSSASYLGVVDRISKPLQAETMVQRIRNYVYLRQIERELQELVMKRVESGLHDRKQLTLHLRDEWKRGIRSYHDVTLIVLEIDRFDHYLELYGADEGERCLSVISEQVQLSFMRVTDFAGQYSRGQFISIISGATLQQGVKAASVFLENVRRLAMPHEGAGAANHVTMSAGVASMVPGLGTTEKVLIDAALGELHRAREGGGDAVYPSFLESIADIKSTQKISWQEHFSVNHPVLDEQHKMLLSVLNQMIDDLISYESGDSSSMEQNISIFNSMQDSHLKYEEGVLSEKHFPALEEHRNRHGDYREQMQDLIGQPASIANFQHLVVIIREWFQSHVLVEDMKYRPYM